MPIPVFTPQRSLSIRRFGPVFLQTTSPKPISQPEWDAYCRLAEELKRAGYPSCGIQCLRASAPNTMQRKQLAAAMGMENPFTRFALVSGSRLVRGAMTAIRWVFRGQPEMRAFAPGEERDALEWLSEASEFDIDQAFALLRDDARVTGYSGLE